MKVMEQLGLNTPGARSRLHGGGRSLIKRLKRIGPKTEPCGTPYFVDSLEE